MRRSTVVQLTLLPMLAVAAVAAADPGPPGMTEPVLSPPGMTPTADECQVDPDNVRCDPSYFDADVADCLAEPDDPACAVATVGGGTVVRGGFGVYFWTAHG